MNYAMNPGQIAKDFASGQNNRLAQLGQQQTQEINRFKLGALKQDQASQNRLAALSQQALGGDQGAMTQVAGQDPKRAKQIQEYLQNASEQEREELLRRNKRIASTLVAVKQSENPGQAWQFHLQQLEREGVPIPPEIKGQPYSPQLFGYAASRVMEASDLMDQFYKGGGYSKSLTPAIGPDGRPVFLQGTESGGARPLEGYRPAGPEYKAREAAAIQGGKESTPGGQARVQADRAQAQQAESKAREAEAAQEKGMEVRRRAVALVDNLLDPQRRDALESATGSIQGMLPSVRQSSADFEVDLEALNALLTSENLDMMSGVLSESDIKILRDVASGGLDMRSSAPRIINRLQQIKSSLQSRINGQPSQRSAPQAGSVKDMSDDDLKNQLGL